MCDRSNYEVLHVLHTKHFEDLREAGMMCYVDCNCSLGRTLDCGTDSSPWKRQLGIFVGSSIWRLRSTEDSLVHTHQLITGREQVAMIGYDGDRLSAQPPYEIAVKLVGSAFSGYQSSAIVVAMLVAVGSDTH